MKQDSVIARYLSVVLWLMLNVSIIGYFAYAFATPLSPIKASLLPGETTHGHYQIELDCNACHGEHGRRQAYSPTM